MSTDYSRRRSARRLAGRTNRRCPSCGRRYTPVRSTGRYCTGRCRVSAYRAQRA